MTSLRQAEVKDLLEHKEIDGVVESAKVSSDVHRFGTHSISANPRRET